MRLNLAPITAFFAGTWRWLLICAACAVLGYLKGCSDGKALNEAAYARAAAQAVAQARKADGVAMATAQAGKAASEAEIDKGREAAKAGPDPWKQATEAMR